LPDSGETSGRSGGKRAEGRLEAHLRAIWVLRRGGEAGGELARRSRMAMVATIRIPVRMRRAPAMCEGSSLRES
jgi:hypothetical protein